MKGSKLLALVAITLGSAVVFLDGTVVTLALPAIAKNFHSTFSTQQWIVDSYLLSLSSLMLLSGSLGDIFGRKKIYMYGLFGFGFFSLLCGISPSSGALIIFRLLQGIFGALLVPGALAIINTNFPMEQRGRAVGLWSAWSGAATAFGPVLGGYLIDSVSWRWIFLINIPFVAVCIALASKGVQESRDKSTRTVDLKGSALTVFSLVAITYGLIQGPVNKWHAGSTVPLIVGFLLFFVFILQEKRSRDPMVPLRLFKSRNFSGANVMTFAMYGALSGFLLALVIYLQTKLHYTAIKAGLSLLPVTIILLLLSGRIGGLSSKYGPRYFMSVGPILAGAAMFSLLDLKPGDSYITFLLPRVVLFSFGLSLLVAPLTTTVITSVSEKSSGIASAINNVVSRVGGLVVVALLGLLGADKVFKFSMTLCASLAISAGLISLVFIKNPKKVIAKAKI